MITLAGQPFTVNAFTLDQLQLVLPKIAQLPAAKGDVGAFIALMKGIVAGATGKSEAEIGGLQISLDELSEALPVIVRVSGLEDLGKKKAAAK